MEFRSKSCRNESLQIENYCGGRVAPTSMQDLRSYSYSATYAGSAYPYKIGKEKEVKVDKGKSTVCTLTIRPQILHACWCHSSSTVVFNLQTLIPA